MTALALSLGMGLGAMLGAAPASAAVYNPPCGQVSLTTWSAKNVGCSSKTIRHVNYIANDGYRYHPWVGQGSTSSAAACYYGTNKTMFQVNGDGGLTGYGV